jgi:hypothetical protein
MILVLVPLHNYGIFRSLKKGAFLINSLLKDKLGNHYSSNDQKALLENPFQTRMKMIATPPTIPSVKRSIDLAGVKFLSNNRTNIVLYKYFYLQILHP